MSWQAMVQSMLGTCLSTFGEAVLHYTPDGLTYARRGIFNETFQELDPGGIPVISHKPNLGIRVSDWVPAIKQEDQLLVRGIVYWARHFEPDGEGGGTWILDKRSGVSGHSPVQFQQDGFTGEFT